jgi:metal-responsive CopG/Arc/MetJ family transcriptional regulator
MGSSTVNLSVPNKLLARIDREAERESRTRSELLRAAALTYLERQEHWKMIFAYADRQVKRRGIKPSDVARAIRSVRRAG